MPAQRDPVSVWFDAAARQFLERAYASPGQWTGQYLAPPSPRAIARLALLGVNPYGRDRWGEVRWVRAYKRAVYYQLRAHGTAARMDYSRVRASPWPARALEWQTGARVLQPGWPARRWAIRIRLHPPGRAASEAAARLPASRRWVIDGRLTSRQSTPADRV